MIDLCTVVFRDELSVLRVQAQSVDLYCTGLDPRNIFVIVNDEPSRVADIDPTWWGGLADRVRVLPREVFGCDWVDNGWVSQQAQKLLAPTLSWQTWTLCLDAKTIPVRALTHDLLLDAQSRARVGRCPIYPVFEASQTMCEQFWDIAMTEQLGPGGVPFMFHNETVRDMVSMAQKRLDQPWPAWFQAQGRLTEFMFYSAAVQHLYGDTCWLYAPESSINPLNICHSEVAGFDRKWAQRDTATTVSIHRRAWPQLTPEQQQSYRDFLIQHGITQAENL